MLPRGLFYSCRPNPATSLEPATRYGASIGISSDHRIVSATIRLRPGRRPRRRAGKRLTLEGADRVGTDLEFTKRYQENLVRGLALAESARARPEPQSTTAV